MGTNFHLMMEACEHCGRADLPLHIGKSSRGWCFTLHVILDRGIRNLDDWRREWALPGRRIEDEYGREVTAEEMEAIITERDNLPERFRTEDFYQQNHAEPGPDGLLRHQLGYGCIGHGEGTWDLIEGEFS